MGEYIPVRYMRVPPSWYEKYDLAYQRYYTKTSSHSDSVKSMPRLAREDKRLSAAKLPQYFSRTKSELVEYKRSSEQGQEFSSEKQRLR